MFDSASRRQEKIRNLRIQFDSLSQKIQRLRMDHIVESDTLIKIKLEYAIQEAEEQQADIEERIDRLEQIDSMILLHTALAKLNYHAQVDVFLQLPSCIQVRSWRVRSTCASRRSGANASCSRSPSSFGGVTIRPCCQSWRVGSRCASVSRASFHKRRRPRSSRSASNRCARLTAVQRMPHS